jgi:hypothetical protein
MGSEVGNEGFQALTIHRICENCTIETLLADTLLHQQMVPAAPFECDVPPAGAADALLGPTVGLELGHLY